VTGAGVGVGRDSEQGERLSLNIQAVVQSAMGQEVFDIAPLGGGCVGQVYQVRLASGERMVAKIDERPSPTLAVEAAMLRYLKRQSQLPVPDVLFNNDRLLLMELLPGDSHFNDSAQEHAAELLAELHNLKGPAFGFEKDTLIGGLSQPNPWTSSWLQFFREHRLLYMAVEARRSDRLPQATLRRLQSFAENLERWLEEPDQPSLIHGDVWTTNVLAVGDSITGFVDPAIYYAHPEIELAFTTLFGTFGDSFFRRYQELRPIAPGFFEVRRYIYNLYPLLVHVRLFGGSYVYSVDQTLQRFGF
jgi:fructosamine-3-kinase